MTATIPFGGIGAAQSSGNQPTATVGNQPTATPTPTSTPPTPTPQTPTPTGTPTPTEPPSADTNSTTIPSLPADAPPALQKYTALRLTRNISADGRRGIANNVDRAESRFNRTLSSYTDLQRLTESGAFTHDAVGVRALAHTTRTDDPTAAQRAADLVYEADNTSASVAVADARRVLHRYGDSMDNQGLRRSAESHLDVAERALDRAERARSRSDDGRQYFGSRAQAITQLRTAHRHAHMVMDFVDRSATPTVTIEGREDPIRNGSARTQYVVHGNVSAPQPSVIESVQVTVNGDRTVRAISTVNRSAPGRTASYQAAVNLTERVNEIDVRVLGSGDSSDPAATATLRLDGDGLTDRQETTLFETDPLDHDSDAGVTARDEADNGVIDSREDFDGDNLTTTAELDLGTDPLAAETDGDGLSDGAERRQTGTDPLAADTDDDGTRDSAEDPDGDGLTNAEEVAAGTDPTAADVDGDGLADPAELDAGTDPLDEDTDDDNLRDGRELEAPFNTDPLDEDTDDDGVLDGNETYTTNRRNATLNVSVDVRGEGDVAGGVTIDRPTHVRFRDYAPENVSASRFVRLESTNSFDRATVTIGYNESRISSNESSLAIYTFNESAGHYDRLASTVDPANDTVTAQTSHFSVFAVFDEAAWETYIHSRQLRVQEIQDQMSGRSPAGGASEIAYVRMYRPDDSYYNSHSIRRFTADGEILWNRTTADLLGQSSAFFDDLELDPTGDLWVGGSGGDYGFVVQVSDDGAFLSQSSIIYLVESEFASNGNLFHISGANLVAITDAGRYDEAANGSIPSSHSVEAIETTEDGHLYVQSGSQYRAGGYTYLPLNSSITAFDTTIDSGSGTLPEQWQITRNGRNTTGYGPIATGPNGDVLTVHSNNVGQVAKTFYLERRSAADGSVVWNHTIGSVSAATAQNHSGSLVDVGVSDEAIYVSVAEEITSLSPSGTERWQTSNPAFNASTVGGTGAEGTGPILGVGEEHVYVRRDIAGSHLSEFGGIALLDPDTGTQTDVLFSSSTPPGSRSNPETEPISAPPTDEPRPQLGPRIFGEVVVDPDGSSDSGPDVPLADSDGDTIPDRFERQGIPLGRTGQTVQLDPYDPDTDGDGLNDSEEVNLRNIVTQPARGENVGIGFEWTSHPLDPDTDNDGLEDGAEKQGWNIPVVNETGETEPYRFDYQNGTEPGDLPDVASHSQPGHIHVDSDPLQPNSDDDALTDYEELAYTKTDPQSDVTYGITARNQEYLEMLVDDPNGNYFADRVGITDDGETLRDIELTDAQNDFDFVWDDTAVPNHVFDRLTFQMADGQRPRDTPRVDHFRSDRWLDNEDEVSLSRGTELYGVEITSGRELDPWDPDTDDDGLTDGQEVRGLTHGVATIGSHNGTISGDLVEGADLDTSPVRADTDGDGYWDGGIGVYGVGHSDNVILYVDNLESGNGVEGDEIVQEQIGYHEYSTDAPFSTGADLDGDTRQEHSNLHLGELHWGTDPSDSSSKPSPEFTLEVDYYEGADQALDNPSWRNSIETNYRMYGLDVTVSKDETVTDQDLYYLFRGDWYPGRNLPSVFSTDQLLTIERQYREPSSDHYMFVAEGAARDIPGGLNQTGIHRWIGIPNLIEFERITVVFTHGHIIDPFGYGSELDDVPGRFNLNRDETIRVATSKTAVHEIGHILDLGELDDKLGDEVYSGDSSSDTTIEVVNDTHPPKNVAVQTWSVMSSGVNRPNFIPPSNQTYTPFSIEELLSMNVERANP